jgi:hypothetical protein
MSNGYGAVDGTRIIRENLAQCHFVYHKSYSSLNAVNNKKCIKVLEHLNQIGGLWQLVEIDE